MERILGKDEVGGTKNFCEFAKNLLTKRKSSGIMTKLLSVAAWFSRLERRPVTPEVEGSSPFAVAIMPLI